MIISRTNIEEPISIQFPKKQLAPLVVSSPHSGSNYPLEFVEKSALSKLKLRSSEDCFVDEIFSQASEIGVPLLKALFPRVFVDVNRGPFELDPAMFIRLYPIMSLLKINEFLPALALSQKSFQTAKKFTSKS